MNHYELQKGKTMSQSKTMESRLVLGPETSWPKTLRGCATFEGVIFTLPVQPVESREAKRLFFSRHQDTHQYASIRINTHQYAKEGTAEFTTLFHTDGDLADLGRSWQILVTRETRLKPPSSCQAQLLLRMWLP